jgi:PAS domain S-box-containing protein
VWLTPQFPIVYRGSVGEQGALRRVATLVAREAAPDEVFAAVAEEVGKLLGAQTANTYRFESELEAAAVGSWSEPGAGGVTIGRRLRLDGPTAVPLVYRRREPVRIDDYGSIPGSFAAYLREVGIRSTVAAPVFVQDDLWGAITASTTAGVMPEGSERQLADFAELVSQSLGNHEARRLLHEERDFATAVVELSQTLICVFDRAGRIVRFNGAAEQATGWTAGEAIGRDARELIVPPEHLELFDEILERAFDGQEPHPMQGWWLTKDGGRRTIEFSNRPLVAADGNVTYFVSTGLDVTERERATAEIVRLASEQAALRRVATLVARSPEPELVFEAVAEEAGRLLGADSSGTIRFEGDTATTVGRWVAGEIRAFPAGAVVSLRGSDGLTAVVARTGRPARIDDYSSVRGEAARGMHEAGYRSGVGAPIVVGGRTWGMVLVSSTAAEPLGPDAERRLGDFAELVALALEGAQARSELLESRARIVSAGDAERRRLERNLHDGAQQRLVSLSLQLKLAERKLRDDPGTAASLIGAAGEELQLALEELRELARGLHPAVLSDRGLAPALEALAGRAPFPVEIAGVPAGRLDDRVEAAVYYLVSESLTNAAKHADATAATVRLVAAGDSLEVTVADDGTGGADLAGGTGIRGLADRVEALGGRLAVESPPGGGTTVRARVPLRPR